MNTGSGILRASGRTGKMECAWSASNPQETTFLLFDTVDESHSSPNYSGPQIEQKWTLYYVCGGFYNVGTRRYELSPLSTTITNRIPIEIVELVMDFMEMRRTLCSAALVCKAWHDRVEGRLYRSVIITSKAAFDRFVLSMREHVRMRENVSSYTHSLHIRNSARRDALPNAQLGDFIASFPHVLGGRMAAMKTLHIHGLHDPLHSTFTRTLKQMSNVTALFLDSAVLCNFVQLRSILGAFTSLVHLVLSKVEIRPGGQFIHRVHGDKTGVMHLRTLCLDLSLSATSLISLLSWLVHIGACQSTEILELQLPWLASPSNGVMDEVNALVESTGSSLLRLTESIACKSRRSD